MDIIKSISAILLLLAVYTTTSTVEAKRWAFISSLPHCRRLPADNRLTRQHDVRDDNVDSNDNIGRGSNKVPPAPAPSHSFVEGESYDDDIAEIMAMGGDPSFMDSAPAPSNKFDSAPDPSHSFVEGESYDDATAEVMAMGGDPFFMGLGDDEKEGKDTASGPDETEGDEEPISSILSSMAGMGGGVMDMIRNVEEEPYVADDDMDSSDSIATGSNSKMKENPSAPPPRHSFVEGESYDDDAAEIMAMGGDPSFMDSAPAPSHSFVEGESNDDNIAEIMAMGGDPSFMDSAPAPSNKFDSAPDPSHSFVEGESYDDDAAEIMAMGGDPFFMGSGGDDDEEETASGPDETEGDEEPISSILSSMAGMGGGVMDVIGNVEQRYATVDDIDRNDSIGSGSNSNMKGNPSAPPPGHSFVEGESYDDDIAEIMAMGGDPFFMDSGDDEEDNASCPDGTEGDVMPTSSLLSSMAGMGGGVMNVIGNIEEERYATDGKGPSPKNKQESSQFLAVQDDTWEWDGTVDEDAHFDFD